MHMESTADANILKWFVEEDKVTGFIDWKATQADDVPAGVAALAELPDLQRVRIRPGQVIVTKKESAAWPNLAPALNDKIAQLAGLGQLKLAGARPLEEEIRSAVDQLLEGDLGDLAASHGGCISLAGIEGQQVSVSMEGACHNCPATRQTIDRNVTRPLTKFFPEIRVRVVEGEDGGSTGNSLPVIPTIGHPKTRDPNLDRIG